MHFKALSDQVSPPSKTVWYFGLLAIGRKVVLPFFRRSYDIHVEKFEGKVPEPCFMVFNHSSRRDFFVTLDGFPYYGRYIMIDSFLRGPMLRFVLPVISDFIFRRRGKSADKVVASALFTINRGINVYLSPEGTTSQNGVTASIRKRTGTMIRESGAGLVTYRIWGSYFVKPTWANHRAKGPTFGKVVNTYTKEQLNAMTPEQINEVIAKDLYFNNYEWIKQARIPYDRENRAECMERVLYTCPKCKKIHTMKSEKDRFFCTDCGYSVDVDEYGLYVGDEVIFDNLYDWDIWQIDLLKSQRQEWIDNPDMVIAFEDDMYFNEEHGDEVTRIEESVRLEMTSHHVRIIGKKNDITVPLDEMYSIFPTSLDTIGITCDGHYYILKAKMPICNRRFRAVHKILKGEEVL